MLHSEYMAAAQRAISTVKALVRYRGLNTGGGWIRNPSEVGEKFVARGASVVLGTMRSADHKGPFVPTTYIDELARLAVETQTGNCSELSALAFNYLKAQGIAPIDYFGVFRGSWNHAFVVLNRDDGVPVGDFARWSEYAIVCDPLYDRAAIAGMLAPWYPKALPFKSGDVVYRIA